MADGRIVVNTRLDNSKIPSDLAELKDLVNNANLSEEAKQSAEELLNTFAKLEVQQAKNNQRVTELKDKLEELTWIAQTFQEQGETRLFDETQQEMTQVQLKLQQAEQNMNNIEVAMGKTSLNARSFNNSINSVSKTSAVADLNFKKIGFNLLRTGLALFSIRSVFTGLGRAMQNWMRSSKEGLQAQADLAYVWQSIGNTLAPIFIRVIGLLKTVLGYVNAITQSFFGFSIFSNASAKSLNAMNKSAKSLKKQLAGFDEMNVLSSQSSGGADSGPVASGFETPDISAFTTWMEKMQPLIESIKNGFKTLWEIALEPLFKGIGDFVMGVGQSFITGLEEIFKWAEENGKVVEGLVIGIGLLIAAFILFKTILLITAALAGLSPLGWIVIAILAIIAAIGFWKNNQEAIQKFIDKSLDVIVAIFKWAFDVIVGILRLPFDVVSWVGQAIRDVFANVFKGIVTDVKNQIGAVIGIFKGIITFITGVFTGDWKKAWQGIVNIFDNLFKGISNIFKMPFNFIIDGINGFIRALNRIKIPDWVPGVGGKGFNIQPIPRLARGGVVTSATQAIIGEAGREAVVPLQNNTGWANDFLDVLQSRGGFGGGGSITIIQQLDGKEIARHTLDLQKEAEFRTNGGVSYGY